MEHPPTLLSPSQVEARSGLTVAWLKRARMGGFGPPYRSLGYRTVRYLASDVDAWLAAQQTLPKASRA